MATHRVCSIPDCGKRHHAHGYCSNHREKFLRHGDPLAGRPRNAVIIETDAATQRERSAQARCLECGKPEYARGFCQTHYQRRRRRGLIEQAPLYGQKSGREALPKRYEQVEGTKAEVFLRGVIANPTQHCVFWPHYKNAKGYGYSADRAVHRMACILIHGDPPFDGAQAAHSCGNSGCVNPAHLRWATQRENDEDKYRHGTRRRRAA